MSFMARALSVVLLLFLCLSGERVWSRVTLPLAGMTGFVFIPESPPSARHFIISPTKFTQTKSKTIGYLIADGEFHTYTLNLASHSEWQGQITGLRFDPTNAAGSIEVDYILDFQPPQ